MKRTTKKQITKQGQIQVTFHWIYVLIAGAVILLFFFTLIVSQRQRSEEVLQQDITQLIGSLFTAATLSEKTKTNLDINLGERVLTLACREGVGEYGLKGASRTLEDPIHPLFSPAELQATQLSLWSLPYKLPYKVIDFLLVTAPTVKYVLVGSNPWVEEFLEETKPDPETRFRINAVHLSSAMELATIDPGKSQQLRVVDTTGTALTEGMLVPEKVKPLEDSQVTAIVFIDEGLVQYYQKQGVIWEKMGTPIPIISLGGERDAARYAAVFAQNGERYECSMQKAFQRLHYLNEILAGEKMAVGESGGKLQQIKEEYQTHPDLTLTSSCQSSLLVLESALQSHHNNLGACLLHSLACTDLILSARQIRQSNEDLIRQDCLSLY